MFGITGQNINISMAYTPTAFSGVVTYTISPPLPTGLSISSTTGVVNGTSIAAVPVTTYTVTGTDGIKTATATIDLVIFEAP
jgi:hypothetical protein